MKKQTNYEHIIQMSPLRLAQFIDGIYNTMSSSGRTEKVINGCVVEVNDELDIEDWLLEPAENYYWDI